MTTLIIVLALVGLLLVSVPLFVIIGVITVLGFVLTGHASGLMDVELVEYMRELTGKPPLLAVPFFVLSGTIMSHGAIASRLVGVARASFSGLPGGLGIATVVACMFFAAISGSSPVTVITIGGVMYPALIEAGYSKRFSTGLVTSAGTLGILIPPSIPMIVYAIFAGGNIKVEDLFLAGLGPGIIIGLLLSGFCMIVGLKKGERFGTPNFREIGHAFADGFWALMLPVIILGGIYSGIFTANDAAAISVVYSLVVELFIHREVKLKDLPGIVGEASVLMGSLLVIFAMAVGLNGLLADLEIPQEAAKWLASLDLTPFTFFLILNGLLLIVGCLMDIMSAIMILVPLLVPMAAQMGIDPIHLGVVFIVNLELGYLTPPMGLNLFVSSSIFQQSIGSVVRSVIPFTGLLLAACLIITYVPTISLGPVRALNGESFFVAFPDAQDVKVVSDDDGALEDDDDDDLDDDDDDGAGKPANGGQSIQDLMKSNNAFDDAMDEDDEDDEDEDDEDEDDEAGGGQPKSIQELMKSNDDFKEAFDEDDE
ncbi:MAG: TRAP transporter large permease [Bradymonadia bacterium]